MTHRLDHTIVAIVAASSFVACRKEAAKKAPEAPADTAPSASSSSTKHVVTNTSAAPSISSSHEAPPLPAPPEIACAPDPRLRWPFYPAKSGPRSLECSSLKVGDAPLTLKVAPGTILEIPLGVEVQNPPLDAEDDDADTDSWFNTTGSTLVRYSSKDLPKLAWIDPKTTSFKWHARGAEGEAFAFSIAAKFAFPEGERCLTMPIVIVVSDTAETRKTQATWVAEHDDKPDVAPGPRLPQVGPDQEKYLQDQMQAAEDGTCSTPNVPEMRDLDGDGALDAVFKRFNDRDQTKVLLRRGDTYASLGNFDGSPERTSDGTMFVVHVTRPYMGVECSTAMTVYQFRKSGLEKILDVKSRAYSEPNPNQQGSCAGPGLGVDYDAGGLIGFTDDLGGNGVNSIWRWNGKAFALTYGAMPPMPSQ